MKYKNVYKKVDNVLKEFEKGQLRAFGIKLVRDEVGKVVGYKVQYQGRLLPSVAFSKEYGCFILYYQAPNNFGQQSFLFSLDDFIFCFNRNKVFELLDNNPNDFVTFALKWFALNPSVLARLSSKNKKGNKRYKLDKFDCSGFLKSLRSR